MDKIQDAFDPVDDTATTHQFSPPLDFLPPWIFFCFYSTRFSLLIPRVPLPFTHIFFQSRLDLQQSPSTMAFPSKFQNFFATSHF